VEPKPSPVADLGLDVAMSLVVVFLNVILSMKKAFPNVGQECAAPLELAV